MFKDKFKSLIKEDVYFSQSATFAQLYCKMMFQSDILLAHNSFISKISLVVLLIFCYTILMMLEFGFGSTNNPLTDIFLYSHNLSI